MKYRVKTPLIAMSDETEQVEMAETNENSVSTLQLAKVKERRPRQVFRFIARLTNINNAELQFLCFFT